jgi:hypothetical protein
MQQLPTPMLPSLQNMGRLGIRNAIASETGREKNLALFVWPVERTAFVAGRATHLDDLLGLGGIHLNGK